MTDVQTDSRMDIYAFRVAFTTEKGLKNEKHFFFSKKAHLTFYI